MYNHIFHILLWLICALELHIFLDRQKISTKSYLLISITPKSEIIHVTRSLTIDRSTPNTNAGISVTRSAKVNLEAGCAVMLN